MKYVSHRSNAILNYIGKKFDMKTAWSSIKRKLPPEPTVFFREHMKEINQAKYWTIYTIGERIIKRRRNNA